MKLIPKRRQKGWQIPLAFSLIFSAPLAMGVQPQTTPAQFDVTGHIENFTLNVGGSCSLPPSAITNQPTYSAIAATSALACTATIVVNGQSITLPANTVITYPASFLTPFETVGYNPNCTTNPCLNETGLAINDTQRLPNNINPATYEAHIIGNVVYGAGGNATMIAGLVEISQEDLNSGNGFITAINFATGELTVGGDGNAANPGTRVKINDPVGRFGRSSGPNGSTTVNGAVMNTSDTQDPRFSVDDGNPTIFAETGYPLCIPRTDPNGPNPDPECPQFNRPLGAVANGVQLHLGAFTMVPAPGVVNPNRPQPAGMPPAMGGTNPMFQAPLEIGDYINWAGTRAVDVNGSFISAHTITANLGIYTTPDTDPAYTTQEVTIVGVGVSNGFVAPAEGRELFKVVGFTTDVYRGVDTGKVIVDPCNGDEGFQRIVSNFPNGSAQDANALLNVPLGRFRSQFLKGTNLAVPMRPATKEIRVEIQGASKVVAANGLTSGQYQAPVSEYIFAENLGFGGLPVVPNNLEDFAFLALGHGPYDLYDPYGTVFNGLNPSPIQGQLAPWPGTPIPASVNCAAGLPAPPIINVANLTVGSGTTGTLNATATTAGNPNATLTGFSWTLGAGGIPAGVTLTAPGGGALFPNGAQPVVGSTLSFVATLANGLPAQTINFDLTVTQNTVINGANVPQSSTKTVTVTVNPALATDSLQVPVTPTFRNKDGSWNVTINCVARCDTNATIKFNALVNGTTTKAYPNDFTMSHTPGSTTWTYVGKNVITPAPASLSLFANSSAGGSVSNIAVSVRIN